MKRLLAIAALALVWNWSGLCRAAALDPSTVAADAKWIVHVDFDAMRESKVGQHAHGEILKHDLAKTVLAMIKDSTGADLEKDLHGATVYGNGFKPHAGVLIVYADAEREKLVNLMKTRPDFKTSKEGDLELYSWTEAHSDRHHEVVVAFPKKGTGVFAGSTDQVKAAIEVLNGKNGLSSSSPLVGDSPKGTILKLSVVGINEAELPAKIDVLKKISRVSIVAGESDGTDFDHIRVVTTDADTAKEFKSIVEGFKAMADLHLSKEADLKAMIDDTKIEADGTTLAIDWSGSSDSVIKLMDRAREEITKPVRGRIREGRRERVRDRKDGDKEAEKKDGDK
jgi:hypothetical protein